MVHPGGTIAMRFSHKMTIDSRPAAGATEALCLYICSLIIKLTEQSRSSLDPVIHRYTGWQEYGEHEVC